MKQGLRVIAFAFIAVSLAACGEKKAQGNSTEAGVEVQPSDPIAEGLALVNSGDCKTCHHPTNKIIGPSHTDVAKKYEFTQANVSLIADRIIAGSVGVWGEMPMNPHPDLSKKDAEKMARYVLSLDGEKEH